MKSELLDLTGKIDPQTVVTITAVHEVTVALELPYIIVGATARDLVLHYGYGTPVQRATKDIDFAVEVDSWRDFENVRDKLIEKGFSEDSRVLHRLTSPTGGPIDIVPFGGVEQDHSSIAWPPDGERVMNVRGFQEASDNAQQVTLNNDPEVICRVVTPEGLMILKLISWADRASELRQKDAGDLSYLLTTYYQIRNVKEDIYNDENARESEKYDWNPDLAACCLLGKECRKIATIETSTEILNLRDSKNEKNIERIAEEISNIDAEKYLRLLHAYMDGFDT